MSEQTNGIVIADSPRGRTLTVDCDRCVFHFWAEGNFEAIEGLREIVAGWHRERHYGDPYA